MGNIDLSVNTRGNVPVIARNDISSVLRDFYKNKNISSRVPYHIELLITDTDAMMSEFIREQKFKMSILDESDEDSACYLDTWQKFPRITVSAQRMRALSKLAWQGALRHEAAHSILHGSLEYRIFRIPDECNQVAHIKGLNPQILEQIVKNVANAVKDYEAINFLISNEFINCQVAYALEWLKPPAVNGPASTSAKTDRQVRFIYQTELLKPLLFCHPLLSIPKSKRIALEKQILLGRKAEEMIELLLQHERNKFIQIANLIAGSLTGDTHHNVDAALHHAMGLA
jgi:hypothetical protein